MFMPVLDEILNSMKNTQFGLNDSKWTAKLLLLVMIYLFFFILKAWL